MIAHLLQPPARALLDIVTARRVVLREDAVASLAGRFDRQSLRRAVHHLADMGLVRRIWTGRDWQLTVQVAQR